MIKPIFIFLTTLTIPFVLFSQNIISGKVKNINGTSVPNASVHLLDGNKRSAILVVLSDSIGQFSIPAKDSFFTSGYSIVASYLNYRSDTVAVTNLKRYYEIPMALNEALLPDVMIEARVPVVQRMADRFIFTPDERLSHGATVLDVLKFAPLVQFDEKTALFSIINRDGTTIYINNRKSNLPKEMIISILRSTSASDIKNIEIITNPGSEYSANTSGGVININLKKMFDEGWSGNLMVASEQSKFNTSMLNGAVNYRKGKIGIKLSPFLNNSFNYNTRENHIVRDTKQEHLSSDNYRRYNVLGGGLGLDYDITSRDLLSFNGFYSTVNGRSRSSSLTAYSENDVSTIDSLYSSPTNGKDRYTYNFGNIYYQHFFDSLNKRALTINVDYNQFYQGNKYDGQFVRINSQGISEESGRYKNDLPQDFFNLSERIDYTTQINNKNKINIGVQYSNTRVSNDLKYYNWNYDKNTFLLNPDLTNNYKYNESYLAGYISYTKTLSSKLNGALGLRAEQINYSSESQKDAFKADTNYIGFFPTLSLAYIINKKNSLSLALSKKIRRPNIEQLFPGRTYYNQEYVQENNPFLQPVVSYNLEVMYALRNKYYFSTGYTLSKDQYTQFIIPLIENGVEKLKKTYLNYGNTSNTYFSFFSQQDFIKKVWNASVSMNINYSTYKIKNQEALFYTKTLNNLNYNFMWNNTFYISNKGKWLGFALFKYYSPGKNISYKRENSLFSADFGCRKVIKNFSLSLYVTDVLNTNGKSKNMYFPNSSYTYNYLIQKSYTRSIALNIRYTFGNNKLRLNKSKNSANEEIKNRIGN
ncbi:MAG: outer membrane beta-barrel family protein [Niabella sp.]